MIVKVNTGNGNGVYNYFEADSIIQAKIVELTIEQVQKVSNNDTLFIVSGDRNKIMPMLSLDLRKKHKTVQWLITNHRTYLMNDEGKTIEKIN